MKKTEHSFDVTTAGNWYQPQVEDGSLSAIYLLF